jgi:hypothetical protein
MLVPTPIPAEDCLQLARGDRVFAKPSDSVAGSERVLDGSKYESKVDTKVEVLEPSEGIEAITEWLLDLVGVGPRPNACISGCWGSI